MALITGSAAARRIATSALAPSLATAAGLHLGVAVQHGLTTQHGGFFLAAGGVQAIVAAALSRRPTQRWVQAAAAVSAAVIGVWLITRLGLLGTSEPVGVLDVTATGFELITLVAAVSLLSRRSADRPALVMSPLVVLAAVVLTATTTTVAAPSHGHHDHGATSGHSAETEPIFGDLFADHHDAG